jgi:hypothetical protein
MMWVSIEIMRAAPTSNQAMEHMLDSLEKSILAQEAAIANPLNTALESQLLVDTLSLLNGVKKSLEAGDVFNTHPKHLLRKMEKEPK